MQQIIVVNELIYEKVISVMIICAAISFASNIFVYYYLFIIPYVYKLRNVNADALIRYLLKHIELP